MKAVFSIREPVPVLSIHFSKDVRTVINREKSKEGRRDLLLGMAGLLPSFRKVAMESAGDTAADHMGLVRVFFKETDQGLTVVPIRGGELETGKA